MNFTFLASFVGAMWILSRIIKKDRTIDKKKVQEFWDKEAKANFIRKKSLDDLPYVTIPESILSMEPASSNETIQSCLMSLQDLSNKKIVNLTGISNTDLKLKYGTANITILSEYDSNYTNLVTTLQKLAEALVEEGESALAMQVLEFAVSTGSDVSKTYYLLSDLYQEAGTPEKCSYLLQRAEKLHTLMRDAIVRRLQASGQ